jgi:hypothetical protein
MGRDLACEVLEARPAGLGTSSESDRSTDIEAGVVLLLEIGEVRKNKWAPKHLA